ncbi:translation initiation factor IF-2-like isoform X3 [Harmonia axyridis]|uniref:translation initiation factor IF-2-like isoform X3 n=1 Tax=Harmonia axyridis TaxID=115357 RepID=UPI001E2792F4|nr:translation initiation factor IF-2-like isoform X3 [Harmonia axyridis]
MRFTVVLGIICTSSVTISAADNKWVWKDSGRSEEGRNRDSRYEKSDNGRYNVQENYDDYVQNRPINDRPIYPNPGLISRPQIGVIPIDPPYNPRPPIIQSNRPGGLYGNNGYGRPNPSTGYYPNDPADPGVLTGPIPSWVKEGPFKNYDTCKCTEKFNCRSPGISYGHCDVGKKYCCYNRNKIEDLGSDYPQIPVHSAENGILVGPGGPSGGLGRPGYYGRPVGNGRPENGILVGPEGDRNDLGRPGGFGRPSGIGRPGFGGRPNGYGADNGVLVGPNRSPYARRRDSS